MTVVVKEGSFVEEIVEAGMTSFDQFFHRFVRVTIRYRLDGGSGCSYVARCAIPGRRYLHLAMDIVLYVLGFGKRFVVEFSDILFGSRRSVTLPWQCIHKRIYGG